VVERVATAVRASLNEVELQRSSDALLAELAEIGVLERRKRAMSPLDAERSSLAHDIEDRVIGLVGLSRYQTRLIELELSAEVEPLTPGARSMMKGASDTSDGGGDEREPDGAPSDPTTRRRRAHPLRQPAAAPEHRSSAGATSSAAEWMALSLDGCSVCAAFPWLSPEVAVTVHHSHVICEQSRVARDKASRSLALAKAKRRGLAMLRDELRRNRERFQLDHERHA